MPEACIVKSISRNVMVYAVWHSLGKIAGSEQIFLDIARSCIDIVRNSAVKMVVLSTLFDKSPYNFQHNLRGNFSIFWFLFFGGAYPYYILFFITQRKVIV